MKNCESFKGFDYIYIYQFVQRVDTYIGFGNANGDVTTDFILLLKIA